MTKKYDRIFAQLFNRPWLITQEMLLTMIEISNREVDIEAVQARFAQPLINAERATVRDGVAIIPVSGPIFPKANLMTEYCGATSVESIARDLTVAMEDDEVNSIILNVDSPGGHVTGINELANMIRSYSADKPIHGYSGGTAASAGYWLLSSCSDVTIDATARVGSIGVVVGLPPKSEGDPIEIVNTASPNKRVDYTTKEGKAVVVEELDALAGVFISSIAEFRGVTESVVTKDFGKGGILVGSDAVKVGMADRIGSFEELLSEKSKGGNSMPKKYEGTAVSLKEDSPGVYDEIFNAGAAAAVKETDEIVASKDKIIASLKEENEKLVASNKDMTDQVKAFQRKEAMQEEQNMVATANAIVSETLAASTVPNHLHKKVRTILDHSKFVVEGKLDTDAYTAAAKTEVAEWEDSSSSIKGIGSKEGLEDNTNSGDTDAVVSRLAGLVN